MTTPRKKVLNFDPNPLFSVLVQYYESHKDVIYPETISADFPEGNKTRIIFCNEGSTRCFAENQLVKTPEGSIPISQLKEGDEVLSHNHDTGEDEYKKVEGLNVSTVKKKCLKIKFKNGTEINCTEDHEIFYRGVYIQAKKLVSLLHERDMERNKRV